MLHGLHKVCGIRDQSCRSEILTCYLESGIMSHGILDREQQIFDVSGIKNCHVTAISDEIIQ